MKAYTIINENNGLTIVYVVPDDKEYDESTLYINFRTPPENSKGIQHIIEHSVLCGSQNFKLKEPFQNLVKGSL